MNSKIIKQIKIKTMSLKIQALRARYEAQRLEALATLEVYVHNAVGIGEHPQVIEEMDILVKSLTEATDCLETLNNTFTVDPENTKTEESVNS
jgi:hypothetical protein|tara:strand:+ start:597 stop:875 length:279 start_codon:yes stop_codon:yes gene_type:complete